MDNNTIYSRFRSRALLHPDAIAVVSGDGRAVSYLELDGMVDSLLAKFIDKGYRTVGIVMTLSLIHI